MQVSLALVTKSLITTHLQQLQSTLNWHYTLFVLQYQSWLTVEFETTGSTD